MTGERTVLADLKLACVRVAERADPVFVPITSSDKPSVPASLSKKWEGIVDLIAEIINVPSGLIMRLEEDHIEVFLKGGRKDNPYASGETALLQTGLYCETVVGRRAALLVPDAREDAAWKDNPDVKLNMVSYLGFPLAWPDGEVFGTICVLDNKRNEYGKLYVSLVERFRDVIEQDLRFLLDYDHLRKMSLQKDMILREIHHRIKNNFNLLVSYVRLKSGTAKDISSLARDIEMRIRTISMLHERIHKGGGSEFVVLKDYVRDLVEAIVATLASRSIRLNLDGAQTGLPFEELIPLGMILNELVTNSIRHGFEAQPDPEIRLRIEERDGGSFLLDYRDNGKGFPEGFAPALSDSLGFSLIRSLAGQMNGACTFGPGREAVVLVEFRTGNESARASSLAPRVGEISQ